jgi:peptidoglycan/LPS O-acetylase OafA/YrhL
MKLLQRPLSFQRITSSGNFIPELDGLRFIAIASVVLYHLRGFINVKDTNTYTDNMDYSVLQHYLTHARIGVPLFFVISGFILGLPFAKQHLLKEGAVNIKNYFYRRLTRLEPPYILMMSIMFIGFVFVAHKFTVQEGFFSYLASLFYAHNIIYDISPKLNGVAWSLEVEVQFYILAPLLAYLFSIKNIKVRRLTLVGIILGSIGFNQFHFNPFHFISLINCLHYFILGFLLVDIYVSKTYFIPKTKFDKLFGLVFFLLIWIFDAKDFDSYVVRYGWRIVQLASIFFFYYYVVFNKTYRFFSFKWITGIGGMCYSIYLLHSPVIGLIGNPIMKFQFSDLSFINIPIFTAILIGAILCISAAFYLLIERPGMDQNWPRKLLKMRITKVLPIVLLGFIAFKSNAQQKPHAQFIDGSIVAGYVDNGAYLNFTGPNISWQKGPSKLLLGMLPSLRYKVDEGTTVNARIYPALGAGLTYSYQRFVFQVPLYYNPKTAITNGNWQVGCGIGIKLNYSKQ